MSLSPRDRERQEAEAHAAWVRHHDFIRRMAAESLLTAEQAETLCGEEARGMWLRTFLGARGVW